MYIMYLKHWLITSGLGNINEELRMNIWFLGEARYSHPGVGAFCVLYNSKMTPRYPLFIGI